MLRLSESYSAPRVEPAADAGPSGHRVADSIDLLTAQFGAPGSDRRTGRSFRVDKPWALFRFGEYRLRSGWWTLE